MKRGLLWGAVIVPLACTPNNGGLGSGGGPSVGEGSGTTAGPANNTTTGDGSGNGNGVGTGTGSESGDTGGGPLTTTGNDTTADGTTGGQGDTTTSGGGSPLLQISDGPTFDFQEVSVPGSTTHAFTVTNTGRGDATGITGSGIAGPFDFQGGAFPGGGGTCGDTLGGGEDCTVVVEFAPTALGIFTDTVAVAYDQGADATRPVEGGGQGQSGNLINNPGGESVGDPVPQWNDVGPGNWVAGVFENEEFPQSGNNYIAANNGPGNNQAYSLQQAIDLGPWSSTIDLDAMRFVFVGHARSLQQGTNDYRIRVHFLNDADNVIETFDGQWGALASWQQFTDDRIAPVGARTIVVELGCRKPQNGNACFAYFDSFDLRAAYP